MRGRIRLWICEAIATGLAALTCCALALLAYGLA